MGREWIKLYPEGWLDGSMSWELNDAAKGVWAGLLNLAGRYAQGGRLWDMIYRRNTANLLRSGVGRWQWERCRQAVLDLVPEEEK